MKICAPSFLLKNVLLHEKKPDIGNGVEPSAQKICPEGSTRWPSTQYFRSILQVIYQNEWEIASFFLARSCPTESTFDGQNLHPQPRYGGSSSRPRSLNLLCSRRIHFQPQFTSWAKVDSMMRS